MMVRCLRTAAVLSILVASTRAEAIPAFARKYGVSCSTCHSAWPILNQVGQNFRDNGYQFGLGKDDPVTLSNAYVPLAIRATGAYQYQKVTNQLTDAGNTDVKTGGVPTPGADLLTAGVVAKNLSYLVVAAGFTSDEPAAIESAWARVSNIAGSSWLNVRVGKFELDLPASSHRGVSLLADYAAYGATNAGIAFNLGENQTGVEIDGHNANSATRYSLSIVSPNEDPGSSGAWSSPTVYGHVQQAFDLSNTVLPWARVGLFGAQGRLPTAFEESGGEPIPGTGTKLKPFKRAGADLTAIFGYPSTPFVVNATYVYGKDDAALGGDPDNSSFQGGFVEVNWVPVSDLEYDATPWLVFARYDAVKYKSGPGDLSGVTAGVRRYLALGPRASMALHVEFHQDKVKGASSDFTSGDPLDVTTQAFMLGLDFAF